MIETLENRNLLSAAIADGVYPSQFLIAEKANRELNDARAAVMVDGDTSKLRVVDPRATVETEVEYRTVDVDGVETEYRLTFLIVNGIRLNTAVAEPVVNNDLSKTPDLPIERGPAERGFRSVFADKPVVERVSVVDGGEDDDKLFR